MCIRLLLGLSVSFAHALKEPPSPTALDLANNRLLRRHHARTTVGASDKTPLRVGRTDALDDAIVAGSGTIVAALQGPTPDECRHHERGRKRTAQAKAGDRDTCPCNATSWDQPSLQTVDKPVLRARPGPHEPPLNLAIVVRLNRAHTYLYARAPIHSTRQKMGTPGVPHGGMHTRLTALLLATLATLAAPTYAHGAASLQLGFNDEQLSRYGPDNHLAEALPRAKAVGAQWWRVELMWQDVAPTVPPSPAVAEDPAWSGYNWTGLDRVIRRTASVGLTALPYTRRAPRWAEGARRPAVSRLVPAGTWRPDPAALKSFATALARRYSGTFPDPDQPGQFLPRLRWFQAWNEPNLYTDLTPQWTRTGGRWQPSSPSHYRKMANAFYAGIKKGNPAARVVSAGTAPFGDLNAGDPRMPPVKFWRELLCVREPGVAASRTTGRVRIDRCSRSVRFDAVAHHPYPIGPPRRTARNADDAVVPDVRKITRLLAPARRARTLRSPARVPLWITEYAWESSPDPEGVSLNEQAQYLQASLYVLWRQGASVITWWQMRDEGRAPAYNATFQSGIFLRGTTPAADPPKPAYTAFRFPFTAYRTNGVARLWGMTPGDRRVTIQAQQGGRWVTAARLRAGSNRIFTGRLRVGPNTPLRAVAGPDTSLVWRTQ